LTILNKVTDPAARLYYLRATAQFGQFVADAPALYGESFAGVCGTACARNAKSSFGQEAKTHSD